MIKPIKNNKAYDAALAQIYSLLQKDVRPGSKAANDLEVLSILVKEYEREHFPMAKPKPIEAIRFRLEQMEMTEKELLSIFGHRSRKSEILSGKRKLNLAMIRKLHELLKIPAEVLIQAY